LLLSGEAGIGKSLRPHRRRTSQHNSIPMFPLPYSFRLLYGLLILSHGRRQIQWVGVTAHPTAEWIARQPTEACGWEWTPRYIEQRRASAAGRSGCWAHSAGANSTIML
jgi:hypothetical protein